MKIKMKILDITDDDSTVLVPFSCGRSVWFTFGICILRNSVGCIEFYKKTRPNSKVSSHLVIDYWSYRKYNILIGRC